MRADTFGNTDTKPMVNYIADLEKKTEVFLPKVIYSMTSY